MKTNLNLVFPGTCRDAFALYAEVFGGTILTKLLYGEAPGGPPAPAELEGKILHMSMPLGGLLLMGCDAPPHAKEAIGGFHIAMEIPEEAAARRIFAALSEGGSVTMPMTQTFWTPLFGMCKDRFGTGWMISLPGPQMEP